MEKNVNILRDALGKFPSSGPSDFIWTEIERKLYDVPLKKALDKLPDFEPDEFVWESIESKTAKSAGKIAYGWYVAAVLLVAGIGGLWTTQKNPTPTIAFSQELIDPRLQFKTEHITNEQYEKLKAYCEAETTVCSNKNFKRLQDEYEMLQTASHQLQQAMGQYNTEPELVRQFSVVEREKVEVLNEMAKMI